MSTKKKNETMILLKDAPADQIKNYFGKVLEIKESGNEFPVNLDSVWPLAYGRKEESVRILKKDFVENVDYQVLRRNAENPKGGRPTEEYWLSTPCLEYFIAKKVKPVFEVYRRVFHASIGQSAQKSISSEGIYVEGEIYPKKLGNDIIYGYYKNGQLYYKFASVMTFLGYSSGAGKQYVDRIGPDNFVKTQLGKIVSWFINRKGIDELLKFTTNKITYQKRSQLYFDLFRIHLNQDGEVEHFAYQFTYGQMHEIFTALNSSPMKKRVVFDLLLKGKGE